LGKLNFNPTHNIILLNIGGGILVEFSLLLLIPQKFDQVALQNENAFFFG